MEDMFVTEFALNEIRKEQKVIDDPKENVVAKAHAIGSSSVLYKLLLYMETHKKTPYPGYCRQVEKCQGLSCCPLDPCCID